MKSKQRKLVEIEFQPHSEPHRFRGIWFTVHIAEAIAAVLAVVLIAVQFVRTFMH